MKPSHVRRDSIGTLDLCKSELAWITEEIYTGLFSQNLHDLGPVIRHIERAGVVDLSKLACSREGFNASEVLSIADHSDLSSGNMQAVEEHEWVANGLYLGLTSAPLAEGKLPTRGVRQAVYEPIARTGQWQHPIVVYRRPDNSLHLVEGHHRLGYLRGVLKAGSQRAQSGTHCAYVLSDSPAPSPSDQ